MRRGVIFDIDGTLVDSNRAHAEDLLTDTTSSDDAARSKPDPDIVRAAIRRTGLGRPIARRRRRGLRGRQGLLAEYEESLLARG